MSSVVDSFNARAGEVEKYFLLLKALERPGAQLRTPDGQAHAIDVDWLRILKANAFLLLYNLVESSLREAMASLYTHIKSGSTTVGTLHDRVVDVWVDQAFKRLNTNCASLLNYRDKARELVRLAILDAVAELDAEFLPISGNIDADVVRELCQRHGVSVRSAPGAKGGGRLQLVKQQRNALGHGEVSFAECGRQYTVSDLEQIKREVVLYMRGVIGNIHSYALATEYAV